jgi:hypothetical protein
VISNGVERFLIHTPNHVAAEAVLARHPAEDMFDVIATESSTPDDVS